MTDSFASIEQAISLLKSGKMIILVDDEDRENEGDLVLAAEHVNADAINFMAKFGRGLICLALDENIVNKLELPLMTQNNNSQYGTAFTISIEAKSGISTGISTEDRARTIKAAIAPGASSSDIVSPGHIFPLKAQSKGVLKRCGQTEGSVDLARLAKLTPAAVICEIMNDDGTMSRRKQLEIFAKQHGIPIVTIKDLIEYRIKNEKLLEVKAESRLPIGDFGDFVMNVFANDIDDCEHFALVKKSPHINSTPLVRIHSECITGDVFGSSKCDCGAQLNESIKLIAKEGGILIYLRQEGRGIGLVNKIKAYALQDQGFDTVEANLHLGLPVDNRDFAVAYQVLKHYKVDSVRLLTNNPQKVSAIEKYGIEVRERVELSAEPTCENITYLKTKKEKMGHLLNVE